MKDQYMNSLQTSTNSPFKSKVKAALVAKQSFIKTESPYNSTCKMSETDTALYSHGLIREVMQASRLKSVWHSIDDISQASKLYAQPRQNDLQEFKFNSIPPENTSYASTCSAKVQQIALGLAGHSNQSFSFSKKLVADNKIVVNQSNAPRSKISVSGLVAYKFRSVSAQKSIGFTKRSHETILQKEKQAVSHRLHCSTVREKKALSRTSKRRYNQQVKLEQAIMSDMSGDTTHYLKQIIRTKKENSVIYNEQMKKIEYIKDYMGQAANYQDAAHVVNAIEAMIIKGQSKDTEINKPVVVKIDSRSDNELQRSRKPIRNKPVLLRHFHFIE